MVNTMMHHASEMMFHSAGADGDEELQNISECGEKRSPNAFFTNGISMHQSSYHRFRVTLVRQYKRENDKSEEYSAIYPGNREEIFSANFAMAGWKSWRVYE